MTPLNCRAERTYSRFTPPRRNSSPARSSCCLRGGSTPGIRGDQTTAVSHCIVLPCRHARQRFSRRSALCPVSGWHDDCQLQEWAALPCCMQATVMVSEFETPPPCVNSTIGRPPAPAVLPVLAAAGGEQLLLQACDPVAAVVQRGGHRADVRLRDGGGPPAAHAAGQKPQQQQRRHAGGQLQPNSQTFVCMSVLKQCILRCIQGVASTAGQQPQQPQPQQRRYARRKLQSASLRFSCSNGNIGMSTHAACQTPQQQQQRRHARRELPPSSSAT